MERYSKLISDNSVQNVFRLYHNSVNRVTIDEQEVDRHAPSAIGHFMLSKFTKDEFYFVWQEVKEQIKDHSLVYARVLKYNKGCHIQPHTDSYKQGQQDSDKSLIIQLNASTDFKGGAPFVNNELIELEQKDGVLYQYDELHEVKPVLKGLRYVINLRLKSDK